jgi:hypothetical protein
VGAFCGALTFSRVELGRSMSWHHWLIPVHQLFRAKIALAARLRRFSALHNNSFKPKPLRGSA